MDEILKLMKYLEENQTADPIGLLQAAIAEMCMKLALQPNTEFNYEYAESLVLRSAVNGANTIRKMAYEYHRDKPKIQIAHSMPKQKQ